MNISSADFMRYVQRRIDIENSILTLMEYGDHCGEDMSSTYITEYDLESYIYSLIGDIDIRKNQSEFTEFYIITASQRFTFFLDHRHTNKFKIKKLAHSSVMGEWLSALEIANNSQLSLNEKEYQMSTNWFSFNNFLCLYNLYLELDKDENGNL